MIQYLFLILALFYYAFNIWYVSPLGNFPINDDFIYSEGARCFAEQGRFVLERSLSSCFLHIMTGGLLCKLFGFSHEILRCYTLIMGFIGVVSIYLICRELQVKPQVAGLLACCYAANPLLVNLSFSFMTDLPCITLTNLFILCLLRAVKGNRRWYLYAGLLLAAAVAIRQTSLLFSAAALVLLAVPSIRRRDGWILVSCLFVLPLLTAIGLERLMQLPGNDSPERREYTTQIAGSVFSFANDPGGAINSILMKFAELMSYIALFLSPALICAALGVSERRKKFSLLILPAVTSSILIIPSILEYIRTGRDLPFNYNLWNIPTLGLDKIVQTSAKMLPQSFHLYLTFAGAALSVVLVSLIARLAYSVIHTAVRRGGRLGESNAPLLMTMASVILTASFVTFEIVLRDFDRYYLLLLTPAIMCVALSYRFFNVRMSPAPAIPLLLLLALNSSWAQQQCMNCERARWLALEFLEKQGATPREIDGGIQYNYTRGGPLRFDGKVPRQLRGSSPQGDMRWWPIHGEKYIVSLCALPGYDCIGVVPYYETLRFKQSGVLILQQHDDTAREQEPSRLGYVERQ
jgi:4-amino-4-deoxy-L-arabinose transferase-like glycosyltransferase